MTELELLELGDYAAALFPPGRGPRLETDAGLRAWGDVWAELGLDAQAACVALKAWVLGGQHQGAWDAGAFVKSLRSVSVGDAGGMWDLACRWVADRAAGAIYRGGAIHEAPSLEEMEARPERWAMIQAVKAVGFDAIRLRTPEGEGTLRAQFRKAYEEASGRQVMRGVVGVPTGPSLPAGPQGRVLELPDLRADR